MKIIQSLSGDPFTKGHHNISLKTKEYFGVEPHKLFVYNPIKDGGLLELGQRYKDAVITLFAYGVRDGAINQNNKTSKLDNIKSHIILASTPTEIYQIMNEADHLVRGVRNDEDREYSLKLLEKFGRPDWITKSTLIKQDDKYCNTSSTKYKIAFAQGFSSSFEFPRIYDFLDTNKIYDNCNTLYREKGQSVEVNGLVGEIQEYFCLVQDLEERGRFRHLNFN